MPTKTTGQILNDLIQALDVWVASPFLQRILNGTKGANEAQDIYQQVQAIKAAPTESNFDDVYSLIFQLNRSRPFRSKTFLAKLQLALFCGKRCAKYLADGAILPTDSIEVCKASQFDEPFLVDAEFVYGAPLSNQRIAYFDLAEYDTTKTQAALDSSGTNAVFHVLSALTNFGENPKRILVVLDATLRLSPMRTRSFARAASINLGKVIHRPRMYSGIGEVRNYFHADAKQPLEQFDDIYDALSEAFHEKDVINRFMRQYQVLENFMVRRQVIEVQKRAGPDKFSIRNFRMLYDNVDKNELGSLKDLFEHAMGLPTPVNGKPIGKIIADRWQTGVINHAKAASIAVDLNTIVGSFPKKATAFNIQTALAWLNSVGQRHDLASSLVYIFRNVIVHNKGTEFHLTHMSISDGIEVFLNEFLIPTVDDLIFGLLLIDRQIVWYPKSSLVLYKS